MALTYGLGIYDDGFGVVTPLDDRMWQTGVWAKTSTPNLIRAGLLYNGTSTIVSGTAGMSYDVAPFAAVSTRGATQGAVPFANDATANVVTTAAPGSNSRYDVVYAWPRDFALDGVDSDPVLGVVQGTAAASPTVPSLAAYPGAIELARILVPSGVTATNSGTTITQTAPFTAAANAVIPFRNTTERDVGTYNEGQLGWLIDTDQLIVFRGSSWSRVDRFFEPVQSFRIASSTIVSASFATLPTTAWTLSIVSPVAGKAKITINSYTTTAAGGLEIGFALSGATTLAADETVPSTTSAGAYGTANTGAFSYSKVVSVSAGTTTVTVQARAIGGAGTKTIGSGVLIAEAV